MPQNVLAKFDADYLLGMQNTAVAFADKDKKITWFNQSFKEAIGPGRIKAVNFEILLNISSNVSSDKIIRKFSGKTFIINFKSIPGGNKNRLSGFLIELIPSEATTSGNAPANEILEKNIRFQNELQKILFLLVKENSLEVISKEILSRCAALTQSDFSLVLFNKDNGKFDFQYHDPKNYFNDKDEIEKTIYSNFSFIRKWLELNTKSLIGTKRDKNIAINLVNAFDCNSLAIIPCFFDKNLLATIIAGKKSGDYSTFEISELEQLGIILSFAISHIRTRELNTTLENRLLQSQKLETIGKLSSGMAHDFSNLLSSIFGSLNLLRKRVPNAEAVERLIDNIENCSIRAKDLTKGLLSFGKPTPKRKELVKPNRTLGEIAKVVTQTFPGSISFVNNVDNNLHDILGNETEIYQILLNLCVNAKEAIEGKGIITLSASNMSVNSKNKINFPLLKEGNYVKFSVSDDGVGIREEDLQRIFDPYFSTKLKDTGSGLGLYVTYGIIKAHSGIVDVTSKLRKGTTFDVYIPAFEPTKTKKETRQYEKIILLADDEPMLSDLLAELLESNGYSVIKVGTGEEAIKLLTEEFKVDLAIIDYNMPKLSGLDTIAEIRKLNFDIPIILSSGSMRLDEDEELSGIKIESRLQKPYEFETMLSTIQKFI